MKNLLWRIPEISLKDAESKLREKGSFEYACKGKNEEKISTSQTGGKGSVSF